MREPLYITKSNDTPEILDYRIRFLAYYIKQNHKTLLDVSCGEGKFLDY